MPLQRACSRSFYRPRKPQQTPYYQALQRYALTWIRHTEPRPHVCREIRDFLRCGIPAHGFARAVCHECRHNFFIAFSCKTRTCPSCATRRMERIAAHAIENLLPRVPVRQWVLSVPKRLRPALSNNVELNPAMLHIICDELRRLLHELCPEAPQHAQIAAISFIQRFGSFLNPHLHYHLCVCDGLFALDKHGRLQFYEPLQISPYHIQLTENRIRNRALRLFVLHGALDRRSAHGMRRQAHSGFSLDGSVRIDEVNRHAAERVIRYCARPPFAGSNLKWIRPHELLFYRFSKPDPHGRTGIYLHPMQLLDHIAKLIPPPRAHLHHYHGALAGNSPLRPYVTAHADRPITQHCSPLRKFTAHVREQRRTPASYTWAELMERIFECNPLECPQCHNLMRIVSFVTDPERIYAILSAMNLPTEAPVIAPAQETPLLEFQYARLVYDERKDLLIELDPSYSDVTQSADPFPDYENSSQEPSNWLSC